jgi:hypothetical protein
MRVHSSSPAPRHAACWGALSPARCAASCSRATTGSHTTGTACHGVMLRNCTNPTPASDRRAIGSRVPQWVERMWQAEYAWSFTIAANLVRRVGKIPYEARNETERQLFVKENIVHCRRILRSHYNKGSPRHEGGYARYVDLTSRMSLLKKRGWAFDTTGW